jgi:hypothetical protein
MGFFTLLTLLFVVIVYSLNSAGHLTYFFHFHLYITLVIISEYLGHCKSVFCMKIYEYGDI